MKNVHFSHRPMFSEARLLRMAPPPGEGPGAKDVPPAAEAKAEKKAEGVDPKAAFRKAQERVQASGAKLKELSAKLKALEDLKAKADAGKELTADELEKHGVDDADGSGDVDADDVAKSAKKVEDEMKVHQQSLDAASVETDQHLSAIESKGPGGALDAAFMRIDAVMNNPAASMGEKIAALFGALKGLQDVFKGIASPGGAPSKATGEAKESTPQGKRESVRQMMKDAGITKIGDLLTVKEANVTTLKGQKGTLEGALGDDKRMLADEQLALTKAKAELEQAKDDPVKQEAVRTAEQRVALADTAVKTVEQQLTSLNADIAKAEASVKTIKEAGDAAKQSLDDFNHGRQVVAANLFTMLDGAKVVPAGKDWDRLEVVRSALANTVATLAENGLDIQLAIPNTQDFLKPFVDNGVDAKDLQTNADGSLKAPEAFLTAVERLITTVRTNAKAAESKGEKK